MTATQPPSADPAAVTALAAVTAPAAARFS